MLFDKIHYKKNKEYNRNTYEYKKRGDNFIFHYIMKWLIIILIVSLFFMIINNIFYNTLEEEINNDIYNNPVKINNISSNEIVTTKSVNDILKNNILDKPIETVKELSTDTKALNTISSVDYNVPNSKVFDELKEIFNNMDNIPVNDQIDFSINL
tara:strand:+ start:428 stop:892 length:465 start_codon:yes stop_codon:yes gene_type:complete